MKKLIANDLGEVQAEFAVVPGGSYSIYAAKHPGGSSPIAGALAIHHGADAGNFPVVDQAGMAVTADLAEVTGIAAGFVAHTYKLVLLGTGMTEGDELAISLVSAP